MPIYPRYIARDPEESQYLASTIQVLRVSDNASFLATKIPRTVCKDPKEDTYTTSLASAIIPTCGKSLSLILNHPNIISLVDIVHTREQPGFVLAGEVGDITVWEDMTAGSLSYLLPSPNSMPKFDDVPSWQVLASQNFQRFSLPEGFCWHVLKSISKALLWLHHGVKETEGIPGEYMKHDDDWHTILIRDVSPSQIWFKRPKGDETYGECKLGGFQWAKISGNHGGIAAGVERKEDAPFIKQLFWPPELYKNQLFHTRKSEIWMLGATVYMMMTGIPPPRPYNYDWNISRMNDKGFSAGIREIVGQMLQPHPDDRPSALELVNRVEYLWGGFRANTTEGMQLVDMMDSWVERAAKGGGGLGL